jgi:DNA-binding transcriptional regulator LsrR (DeoR family)
MSKQPKLHHFPDPMLFALCEQFFKHELGASEIKEWLERQYADELARLDREHRLTITRETIYPLLREAVERGFVLLRPPETEQKAANIKHRYRLDDKEVRVVNVKGPSAPEHVATAAAHLLLELIHTLARGKPDGTVAIGLGAGFTTLSVCGKFAELLRAEPHYPSLVLHALTSVPDTERPLSTPMASFALFDPKKVRCVGLFAPPVVRCEDYQRHIREDPWLRDLFAPSRDTIASRENIDVIVFSLAQADDPHGLVNRFVEFDPETKAHLDDAGRVGDVAFLPFNTEAPIPLTTGNRAVTLFELSDLAQRAANPERTPVVLVASRCTKCQALKTKALRPLLESEKLRVWSHLILDMETADELLAPAKTADTPRRR